MFTISAEVNKIYKKTHWIGKQFGLFIFVFAIVC